jgi:c-di-GMP-related signal transduction protein
MSELEHVGLGSSETSSITVAIPGTVSGYLGRQPILDRRGTVFGYELHFHRAAQSPFEATICDDCHGLLDALAIFGVERFTAGSRGFLSCTPEMIVEGAWEGLPPSHTVLELPSPSEPFPKLVRACRSLHQAGFQLGLLNFNSAHAAEELLELVDYVKVDGRTLDSPEWDIVCRKLFGTHAIVIADNIQTHDAHRKARALGIKYFQGFYFCNPEFIPSGKIPAHRALQVQMLRELFKDPLDLKTICPLVMADASLVYRVLRFVNSPLCAMRDPVTSIESALMILGDNTFRRIATLAIQCALAQGQTPELLNMALVRARFCSSAAALCGLDPDEQYLLGMLSLLPPMLGVPMETILLELPLRNELLDALAGTPSKQRALLSWIENLEENRIPGCELLAADYDLDRDKLAELYFHALEDDPKALLVN